MTGKDLIEFIQKNKLEDCKVLCIDQNSLWHSEYFLINEMREIKVVKDGYRYKESVDGEKVLLI